MGNGCCGERLETRDKKRMRMEKDRVERELERLAEQNEKISFHAEYEEEETAWRKVTPVG